MLLACVFGVAHAAIPDAQRQVLLNFFFSTGGAFWTQTTGWNGVAGTECSWLGIVCDATGSTVLEIDLDNNNLTGSLPALDALPDLQVLSSNGNSVGGSLPPLAALTALKNLQFEGNHLSGSIPPLTGLVNLEHLYFDGNQLSGSIPSLDGLNQLIVLSANNNQLSGTIPSLADLTNLASLYLPGNQLSGSIPDLSALGQLKHLDLHSNQLTGSIPTLSALSNLNTLDLHANPLTGTVPSLAGLVNLQTLSLRNAQLSGSLPSLAGLTALQVFDVASNQFTGAVPAVPSPTSALIAGASTLCPNLLTHDANTDWDAATGQTPWYTTCVATTTTAVTSSQNPSQSGHSVTFTATVSGFSPSGNVTFSDGASVICSAVPLASGAATCSTAILSFGVHSISATYAGDAYNTASTSPIFTQSVNFVGYVPLNPARLLETRSGAGFATIDGLFLGNGAVAAQTSIDLTVVGRGAVPASGVDAVVLNVTATNPTAAGFLTVWPSGDARPRASNLNFIPAETVPNLVVAKVGADGKISIFNSAGSTDVVADVVGYFTTGSDLTSLVPERLLDTRAGLSTSDGQFAGIGALPAAGRLDLTIAGRPNIPASGVGTVVLNVTVASATASGFVTVWPTGSTRPLASNLNFSPGQIVPNLVFAQVGTGGHVSLFNSAGSTDLVADVVGWFPATQEITSLVPARIMDTRLGFTTSDGLFAGTGALPAQTAVNLTVAGRGGVPATGVGAVILNVTVTNPSAAGFVTAWPTGGSRPLASSLNFTPGETIPNLVIAKVGANGQVSLFNSAGHTDLVVDVAGWFPVSP